MNEKTDLNNVAPKRKYKDHAKSHELYCYNRRQIYNFIKENGTNEKACKKLEKSMRKVEPEIISDYLNSSARRAQENVHEEIKASGFKAIEAVIKYFEENKLNESSDYEIPMIMKMIAETENHPKAKKDEIDFASLYRYLSDIMRGNVPKELNAASEKFLMETFEDLLKSANCKDEENQSELSTKTTSDMEDDSQKKLSKSLDPLCLNTWN